jgi:hypothetical protein
MRLSLRVIFAVCTLAVALGGCVAVPLAQIAVSQMSSANPPCPGCSGGAPTGALGDISKGVSDSFHKLTGAAPDSAMAGNIPAK